MLNFLKNFFGAILIALLAIVILGLNFLSNHIWVKNWRQLRAEWKQQRETQQSLEELGCRHSENYVYIASTTPRWVRLYLSKHRGKRKALLWRIKLLQLLNIVGPKTACLLLKEYMITPDTPIRTAASNEWTCSKCGTYNEDTALFCKDCGEYK